MIKISVVICTYNRYDYLSKAISSLLGQTIPKDDYEILIIDNCSTDITRHIVEEFQLKYNNIRYFYEGVQGLSAARNRGIKEAKGELVAFLDDDAEASEEWLGEILKAFCNFPNAACLGGKIELVWPNNRRPDWLNEDYDLNFGKLDLGNEVKSLQYPESPYGGNFCIKKEIFNKIGYFNENLGRKKDNLLSSEEIEFISRVYGLGLDVLYIPNVKIFHHVLPYRINKKYLLDRIYWQARSNVIVEKNIKKLSKKDLINNLLNNIINLLFTFFILSKLYIFNNPIFDQKIKMKYLIGKIQQEFLEINGKPFQFLHKYG